MHIAVLGHDGQISVARIECEVPHRALASCCRDRAPVARVIDDRVTGIRSYREHATVGRRYRGDVDAIRAATLRCFPIRANVPHRACRVPDDDVIVMLYYRQRYERRW